MILTVRVSKYVGNYAGSVGMNIHLCGQVEEKVRKKQEEERKRIEEERRQHELQRQREEEVSNDVGIALPRLQAMVTVNSQFVPWTTGHGDASSRAVFIDYLQTKC